MLDVIWFFNSLCWGSFVMLDCQLILLYQLRVFHI